MCQKKKRKFLMNKNTAYSASANVCLPESELSFSHPLPASGNALQHYFYSSKENIPLMGMKMEKMRGSYNKSERSSFILSNKQKIYGIITGRYIAGEEATAFGVCL